MTGISRFEVTYVKVHTVSADFINWALKVGHIFKTNFLAAGLQPVAGLGTGFIVPLALLLSLSCLPIKSSW